MRGDQYITEKFNGKINVMSTLRVKEDKRMD